MRSGETSSRPMRPASEPTRSIVWSRICAQLQSDFTFRAGEQAPAAAVDQGSDGRFRARTGGADGACRMSEPFCDHLGSDWLSREKLDQPRTPEQPILM